jgi:hypothetical protein
MDFFLQQQAPSGNPEFQDYHSVFISDRYLR